MAGKKPLTSQERDLLQGLMNRAQMSGELSEVASSILDQYDEWSLAGDSHVEEMGAMTDAPKRRMLEPKAAAVYRGADEAVVPPFNASDTSAATPSPMGCAKKGTIICLPKGVGSVDKWGDTIIDFGKFKDLNITYYELFVSDDNDHQDYVRCALGRADCGKDHLLDLARYVTAMQNIQKKSDQRPVIPGTHAVRRFRKSK